MSRTHNKTLESIRYSKGNLSLMDQRKLPLETVFDEIHTVQDIWTAIQEMRVRGAPAIAVSAALGIAVAGANKLHNDEFTSAPHALQFFKESCDYVITSRPTAVNLQNCLHKLQKELNAHAPELHSAHDVVNLFTSLAEELYAEDIAYNEGIMQCGALHIMQHYNTRNHNAHKVNVLTICNPGALATARYGTALGVIRQLFYDDHLNRLYACETRPWNQGARLTVYECVQEEIPVTLICDSAAAFLMQQQHIDAVVVGADRICLNGDTANKIGTYHLAVAAQYHKVLFYVAAPSTTLDPHTENGAQVKIEERSAEEIICDPVNHMQRVATGPCMQVWNPVFDITPGKLITGGIITEKGVFEPASAEPYYNIANIINACNKQK